MNIKITTDSTCDLTKELADKYEIDVLPLYILKGGKLYRDGLDVLPRDIFKYTSEGRGYCTTVSANVSDYVALFEKNSSCFDAVVHICLGSGFSHSYKSALCASERFGNVYVIDSRNLSSGQGLMALEAVRMAKSGMDVVTLIKKLNEFTEHVRTSFLLDRFEYIYKGGRCSLASAMGAGIMHLKPCVEVRNGMMEVEKKYRGTYEHCVEAYVKDRLQNIGDIRKDRIFVTYTEASDSVISAACSAIRNIAAFDEILITKAGCTVSCHCGPGTIGVLFINDR